MTQKRPFSPIAIVLMASVCLLGACTGVVDRRGFLADESQQAPFQDGVDTKETVLSRMGNPSQTGTFDEQTWYYISAIQKQTAFYKPRTTERTIMAISFDDSDKVASQRKYTLADGRVIAYDNRRTPTRGREVTFLEQIFGSIGRAPVQLPGSDPNLPTSAGGPRRN
ncbi:outer membrane protein assembly factor BamE [Candidatus Phycosocius bacilliformis]|uniref:Outer membrane protein assembly factor BamE n=1 Tax=Candidatus Phycosocius bacilliformis TaxID=1445552 RepID=A0A2P2E8G8_9PROT|nr:outer membrane protein assembly factor BamE [Candidatus Phycosocius bacilliformis]GBF57358.1 outer membrane protein assembly factor BamE [Candidatus Phycosocius bacilliformis]